MLAKLLNSERKENIDKAYDALLSALNESYKEKTEAVKDGFADKKNALARNRAKAEKYLGYFMTEKGYENSGVEADAKTKAQIGYNADMAALGREEEKSKTALAAEQHQKQAETEAARAKEKSKADEDLEEQLYRIKTEQDKNDLELEKLGFERYFKEKELEVRKLEAEVKKSGGADGTGDALNAYRYLNYKSMLEKAEGMDDPDDLQAFYDSVTGINAERAAEVLGSTNYKNLLQTIEKKQKAIREKADSEARIESLYGVFVTSYGKEYHGLTYRRLAMDLKSKEIGAFTRDELDEAYDRFKNDLQNGVFDAGEK
jgi:hypothetical protein